MYQIQIYVSEVRQWYGWAHGGGLQRKLADAKKQEWAVKTKYGWETRIVKVK